MNLPVAILAGGLATRLHPITLTIPKSLVEVAGRPFIVHQLEMLREQGFSHVVLCVGKYGEMIEAVLGDGRTCDMNITYSYDGDRLVGTGGAIRKALPQLGEQFLVMYGDSYLCCDFVAVQQAFLHSGQPALMTVFRNQGQFDRSNVRYTAGEIFYDKHHPTVEMQHIDYGLGALSSAALQSYPSDTPFDLADVYHGLALSGCLAAFEVTERFFEIGSPLGLEETRLRLSETRIAT